MLGRPRAAAHGVSRGRAVRAPRRTTLAALVVVALLALAGCSASPEPNPGHGTGGATGAGDGAPGGGKGTDGSAPDQGGTHGEGAPSGQGGSGTSAGSSPTQASEILPGSTPSPQPTLGASVPVLTTMPASGEAQGSLVTGFPGELLPVGADWTIDVSSLSSQGDRLQVGLRAASAATAEAVQEEFVTAMAARGFVPAQVDAAAGALATQYTRGPNTAVLTLRPASPAGTDVMLIANLVVNG